MAQEIQVLSLRVKAGGNIIEHWLGDDMRLARFQLAQLDGRLLIGEWEAIGQPASIGRPVHAPDAAEIAAIQHARRGAFQVNRYQFVAVIAQRYHVISRRNSHRKYAPELDIGKGTRFAGILRIENDQAFSPWRVGN